MTRQDTETMLVFLANDTLHGEERAVVEAAVAADPDLQDQLAALRAIRDTMQAQEVEFSPGEIGLARLMKDAGAQTAPMDVARIGQTTARPWIWQAAAAVLLAVVAVQYFLMPNGLDVGGYELAGSSAAIEIAFAPDTPENQLRALLLEAGVEIIAGPSALGLYQLALLDGTDLDNAGALLAGSDLVESLTLSDPE